MFRVSNTYNNPSDVQNAQRGFPAPGAGAQTTGQWTGKERPGPAPELQPVGADSWEGITSADAQRGMGPALDAVQFTTRNEQPIPQPFPVLYDTWWPDRGAAGVAPDFGQVVTNPIGAGVQVSAPFDVHARGPAGQYFTDTIFWTSQVIPTSVHLDGLLTPEQVAALVDPLQVYGAVYTTG